MAEPDTTTRAVGPYLLQKTLGKGQTGLVKLGVHCVTQRTAAVKIINREKLSKSVMMKVEREIAIMKLIDHPHVLGLYDVYENNTHLYLILEHVSGGELFDYLVKKGRLSEREGRRFFTQIVSAVDFCHKHSVCHRDLKPENLLLDEARNIKVADFGMASLQVTGTLLETSCGSPHYACPEVIRGENYDGRKADVWSLGVILFALLVGSLPFDDDNLRVLLEKVKRGNFTVPVHVPAGARELIRGMVEVNHRKRLTLDQVMQHPWFRSTSSSEGVLEPVLPMRDVVSTCPLSSRRDIDMDVFKSMTSLGCFKDKHGLLASLLSPDHNEEKIIYFLLLERKEKHPSIADDTKASAEDHHRDPIRKRVDSHNTPVSIQLQRARSQSIGSAGLDCTTPPSRPSRVSTATPPAAYTPSGYYSYSPIQNRPSRKTSVAASHEAQAHTLPHGLAPPNPGSPWKRRLSTTLKTFVSSPRFHRRKMDGGGSPDASAAPSPQSAKRSWFTNFKLEKEKEEVTVVFRERSLEELKESLKRAFTRTNVQVETISETMFKCKYDKSANRIGKPVLKKKVKFTASIGPVQNRGSPEGTFDGKTYSVTFTQTQGPSRRFRRLCDKIQTAMEPGAVNMLSIDCPDNGSDDDVLPPTPAPDATGSNGAQQVATSVSQSSGEVVLGPSPDSSTGARPSILGDSSDSEDDLLDRD